MFCLIQELEMKLAAFQEQATAAENVSETFEEKVQAYEQKMKVRFAIRTYIFMCYISKRFMMT